MSVASQWKLKEKEAAAASAAASAAAAAAAGSKTGIPGVKGKPEAPAKDVSCLGTVYGSTGLKGQVEKSGKMETAKLGAPQVSKPGPPQTTSFGKQGVSKLPVGKDTLKTKEADAVQTKDGSVQSVAATPSSKIPKENTVSVGGRKPFGAGLKKEEPVPAPAIRSKAEDNKVKSNELKKEPVGGAKDSAVAAAGVAAAGDDGPLGPGRTKGLAGFWANQNDEVKTVKKKRLTAVEDNLAPTVVENSPQQLEGVVRALDPGEWKKPLEMEDGWTKNVVSSFQKRQQESFSRRAPISLVEDTSSEKNDAGPPDAEAAKVKVKDISQRLTSQQTEPNKQVKEKLVIDRSQGAIVLAENQPTEVDPDVVRSDDASKEEVVLEKGRTRNLLQLWKDTEVEYNAPKTSTHRYQGSKPAWILEIEAAKGNSVDKNDEGQTEENNTMEANDESGKIANQYEERNSIPAATEHANDDKQNIAADNKSCVAPPKELDKSGGVPPPEELDRSGSVPPPKELDKSGGVAPPKELDKSGGVAPPKELDKTGGVPLLSGNRDAEATKSSTLRTDETNKMKLKENNETIKKEIPYAEISTAASFAIVSHVQEAETQPGLVPREVEITKIPFTGQLAEETFNTEARVEQSSEVPFEETTGKCEVSQQVNDPKPLERKEVSKIVAEETKPDSDVSSDAPSSSPDPNKTLQESSEIEKEVEEPSTKELAPIHKTSETDDQRNEQASQQQVLLPESSSTTLNKADPGERAGPHDEARPSPSTEIKPNEFVDVPHSDAASSLTDSEYIGLKTDKSENDMALGQNKVAGSVAVNVEPIQRHDSMSESAQNIEDATLPQSSRLTDDYVANESPIKNIAPLPQGLPDHSGQPEVAPHRVPEDVVKIQPQTNPVCEENKVAMMTEDHEEFSDHEIFATPTTSVILSPLGSFVGAMLDESRDSETRERKANTGTTTTNESSLNEGTLIDLQTESLETGREKLSLLSLDDLLQIETSPRVDHSRPSDDNTPCLVPLSSPSTPEQNISSQRSSGAFDSESDWFSPQEATNLTTAKTETISTHDENDFSSESLKSKTVGGNTSEQANIKADASQRSCRVM